MAANPNTSTQSPCNEPHLHGTGDFRPVVERAWKKSRWRQRDPRSEGTRARLRHKRRCARSERSLGQMNRIAREERRAFREHRERKLRERAERRALTPYRCGGYGRFAVPCYIVACESGYSWAAYNPSGAAGAYQIMPEHGRPWPVDSAEDKRAHHSIASDLWRGGAGASNWVCS